LVNGRMLISAEEILQRLPHRHPFLLVDRVVEVVPGRRAVAIKTISADSCSMRPAGTGFSSEMLVIEAMAQTGALAYACRQTGEGRVEVGPAGAVVMGYLAGLNDVVFHNRPAAGDTLELTLEYVAAMGPMVRFKGTAKVMGETVVEAGLTFTVDGVTPQ
jgi:3-hydroxyacyl-[acyl-carrier-protein] dehydratase